MASWPSFSFSQHSNRVKLYKGKIQCRNHRLIKQFIESNPTARLDDILTGYELNVSKTTLSVYLKKFEMPSRKAKARIVVSNINKEKRVNFCRWMLQQPDEYIDSICFSDETMVKSRPNGEVVMFRMPQGSEWSTPSNGGGGKSVMFWGCASKSAYGPLVEVVGKNTARATNTLKDYLLPEIEAPSSPLIFQQDNASIHKTAAVKAFMAQNGIRTFEWPPQSPDLSPIENL